MTSFLYVIAPNLKIKYYKYIVHHVYDLYI